MLHLIDRSHMSRTHHYFIVVFKYRAEMSAQKKGKGGEIKCQRVQNVILE